MANTDKLLKDISSQFKANGKPAQVTDFENLVEAMEKNGVSNPAIPEELKTMWEIASEWHLIKDHYRVFGFNIFNPNELIKVTEEVTGGEELRKVWLEESPKGPCGGQDWLCLASYSEYDYIFVNFNKESESFGSARHMVNNGITDEEVTKAPFSSFISYVKDNLQEFYNNTAEAEEEED